jgi:hypothetical protein
MALLDWTRLATVANADGEFRLLARFWNAAIRLEVGAERWRISVRDGEIAGIEPWGAAIAGDLAIIAAEDEWQRLLAPVPKPFYHDIAAAAAHHGFDLIGDIRHRCAYYRPAPAGELAEVRHG